MALSTKDLNESTSVRKTIVPGNQILKINSVNLEPFKFVEDSYHLMLHVETKPINNFEGFLINPDSPEEGNYNGQIGRVKSNKYAYSDGETKSGIKIERDRSILMFIKNLCTALDASSDNDNYLTWFSDQDGEHETIENFVEAFDSKIRTDDDVYLKFCIAGKEYENKNGYINYDMYLPKAGRGQYIFGSPESNNVIEYSEDNHLVKLPVKNIEAFGDDVISMSDNNTNNDFSLD